jgi:hypothetical protein
MSRASKFDEMFNALQRNDVPGACACIRQYRAEFGRPVEWDLLMVFVQMQDGMHTDENGDNPVHKAFWEANGWGGAEQETWGG